MDAALEFLLLLGFVVPTALGMALHAFVDAPLAAEVP